MSKKRVQRLESWILNDAVEFWSKRGIEPATGAGVERLDASGKPRIGVRLVANQAKLAYVFARAEMFSGVRGHQRLARGIFDFVSRQGVSADRSDGYLHSFDQLWRPLDTRYILADHCWFCIASLATYAAYGNGADMRRATNILRWMERKFATPDNDAPQRLEQSAAFSLPTRIALVDTFLVFFETTRRTGWLDRALTGLETTLQGLEQSNPQGWRLQANSDVTRQTQTGSDACRLEDQLEFVWLLCRARRYGGERAKWSPAEYWQCPAALCAETDVANFATATLSRIVKVSIALHKSGDKLAPDLFARALEELHHRIRQAPLAGYIKSEGDGQTGTDTTEVADLFELLRICVAARLF